MEKERTREREERNIKYRIYFIVMITAVLLFTFIFATLAEAKAPSPPWVQHGVAYVQVLDVPIEVARAHVPPEFQIVPTKNNPNVTQGSIYVAKYDNTSSVEYSELIFICATVSRNGVQANWVNSIYVDNEDARQAGINVWHLPKYMVTFEWNRPTDPNEQHIKVSSSTGSVLAEFTFNDKALTIPFQSQTVATFSVDNATSDVYLSNTKQKYGVRLLSEAIINIGDHCLFADIYNSAVPKTKVAMEKATFDMTLPTKLNPSPAISRAANMFTTTPERPETPLLFEGDVPSWFRGVLIRNSPGGYENGNDQVRHWNDGWAQIHRWRIGENDASHQSLFLNTTSYWKAFTSASMPQAGYGTPAHPGPRPHDPITPPSNAMAEAIDHSPQGITDKFAVNPMVNIWKFDNKWMATTDQNLFVEFDPVTLKTASGGVANGAWDPNDPITKKGVMGIGVAHGRFDRWTKEHFWLEIDMGMVIGKAKYNIWTYKEDGKQHSTTLPSRRILGTFEDDKTSFVHSFALTEHYIIVIQCPMHYSFLKFMTAKEVIDTISWDSTTPVKFHVMNRTSGKVIKTITDQSAWFVYHIANAYETTNSEGKDLVHIDFSKYNNDTLITYGMYLENIVNDPSKYVPTFAQARMTRCTMEVESWTVNCEEINEETFEMGTFNWEYHHMKPYTYAWGASFQNPHTPWNKDGTSDFIDKLIKVNVNTGKVEASWHQDNVYVCEPLFQQRPNSTAEDDGVLMFVGYNATSDTSSLILLNGSTMEELAHADMGARLAANFHGKWIMDGKDYAIGL
jgi:beta,beta-carotene 9',10'-dioxygenase